jgi:tRNA pseudouridine38-40 synthase
MRYFFRVEYNGAAYAGWQSQLSQTTVQSTLIQAFQTVTRKPCVVVGGGRTDAGVHAAGQGAHLDVEAELNISQIERSVNAVLPADIALHGLRRVDATFHARFSALSRRYTYYIVTRKTPLWYRRAWAVHGRLDWTTIGANIDSLIGRHDFSTFCATGHSAKTMLCTVERACLAHASDDLHLFTIQADRFLYKMVRSIVGTLIEIGRGSIEEPLGAIIASRDRTRAGATAPPFGLVLEHISYQEV